MWFFRSREFRNFARSGFHLDAITKKAFSRMGKEFIIRVYKKIIYIGKKILPIFIITKLFNAINSGITYLQNSRFLFIYLTCLSITYILFYMYILFL